MKIEGPKKLVKRATLAAKVLGLLDNEFELSMDWNYSPLDNEGSYLLQSHSKPTNFLMMIQPDLPKPLLIEAVGHEMVHLRQYVLGHTRDVKEGVYWHGVLYPFVKVGTDEYYLAPWEMEARAYEEYIAVKWENRKRELH